MDSYFSCVTIFCVKGKLLGCWCRAHHSASCLSRPDHICWSAHGNRHKLHSSSPSYYTSWPAASSSLIWHIHHHILSSFICTSTSILSFVQCYFCLSINTKHVCGFACVSILASVVAKIDGLMPKRKFPRVLWGIKQAGINVCVCGKLCWLQWWGRMIAFWKKRDREGREAYPWSLLSASVKISHWSWLVTQVTDERLDVVALTTSQFSSIIIQG